MPVALRPPLHSGPRAIARRGSSRRRARRSSKDVRERVRFRSRRSPRIGRATRAHLALTATYRSGPVSMTCAVSGQRSPRALALAGQVTVPDCYGDGAGRVRVRPSGRWPRDGDATRATLVWDRSAALVQLSASKAVRLLRELRSRASKDQGGNDTACLRVVVK